MKKIIALLCTLCMIATMVPFTAMADGVTVHVSWSGANAEDILKYNNLFKSAIALVPNDGKAKDDYAYENAGIGGKETDDYYVTYDYINKTTTTNNYLMYGADENQTIRKANYFAIKYNIFGNQAALTPQLRISGTVKPTLFTFDEADKLMFKAGVWNTVMLVVDTNNNKVWAYVNGLKTHVADVSNVPAQLNAEYTKLNQMTCVDRIMLHAQGINATQEMLSVDDIYVAYSATEIFPSAVDVTSTGETYGDSIIASGAISNIASAGNTTIVYNGTAATRGATTATVGNIVSVESTDSTFGKMYTNYEVKTSILSKSWDGTAADNVLGYSLAGVTGAVATDAIGGKVNDSYGAFTANPSGECVIYGSQSYSTRFATLTLNIYGKGLNDIFPRIDGVIKPSVITGTQQGDKILELLEDNRWNNVFFVFDSDTKDMKTYINGVLKSNINLYDALENNFACTTNRIAGTAATASTPYNANLLNLKTDLRIRMANGKTSYMDDVAFIYTEFEPKPFECADISVSDAVVKGGVISINKGAETATVTASGATVMVNNGTAWAQTNTVRANDSVVAVTSTPYGNIYSGVYGVVSGDYKETIATQDTMAFVQGGYPWVTDENGENGYNLKPTGAGNDVLVKDAQNVWGSKFGMKELRVGFNYKNSTQTYYQTSWNKAQVEQKCNYLVVEADIAFTAENPVASFGMSTTGGTNIASRVNFGDAFVYRVNHYVWIYDITEGKYVDYINGEPLVNKPVAVDAKFADGTNNVIRFTANGTTKMSAAQVDGKDVYGQYTETLGGYIGNLKVYGAVYAPDVVKAPVLAGSVGKFYPVYDNSTVTLDYVKSQITGADNVYVYKNRGFADTLENGTDKVGFFYMIVAEKDGVFSYYRVCQKPTEDSMYAFETFQQNTKGGYSAVILNLGEATDMALTFAEKTAADDFVKCEAKTQKNVPHLGAVSLGINDVAKGNNATVYVWESFETLIPLADTYSVVK